jgi:hypothetical protein
MPDDMHRDVDHHVQVPAETPSQSPKRGEPTEPAQQEAPLQVQPLPPLPPPASGGRFRTSRSYFNTYASSRDRQSLHKSLSSYVKKGTGGRRGATRRVGASIPTATRIIGFVQDVARTGVNQALLTLGLGNLVGQPAEHILAALTDVFCPAGGPIDQAIAREAWDESVLDLADSGIAEITEVTAEQWQALVGDFIAKSIETKVINDIGAKGIDLPQDIRAINQLQNDLHQLIRGAVDDAIGDRLNTGQPIPQDEIQTLVIDIYERSFAYLEALEE